MSLLNNWIPVTDRLPEEADFVLVTTKERFPSVYVGWYSSRTNSWYDHHDTAMKVSAWMKLPEPYQDIPSVASTINGE